jgi:hypothetical protein
MQSTLDMLEGCIDFLYATLAKSSLKPPQGYLDDF